MRARLIPLLALALGACEAEPAPDLGVIATVVGSGAVGPGEEGVSALDAKLYLPMDVLVDPAGAHYVVDWNNNRVRRWDRDADEIHTVIGSGATGDGPDGPLLETRLNHCTDLAFGPDGRVLLADWHNSRIKEIDFAAGTISELWGTAERGYNGEGLPPEEALLDLPVTVDYDSEGRLVYADQGNNRIRRIDHDGLVRTIAGNGRGTGRDPETGEPSARCIGANPGGTLECYEGDGGPATDATLNNTLGQSGIPMGRIDLDAADHLYIADTKNHVIRRVDAATGIITTLAGRGGEPGFAGDGGPATEALLQSPHDLAVGPEGRIWIADTDNHCVRRLDPDGTLHTAAGQCGQEGYEGDGGPPEAALLHSPFGVAVGPDGTVYVADSFNHVIRGWVPD